MSKNVTLSSIYNFTSGYGEILHVLLNDLPKNGYDIYPRTYSAIGKDFLKYFDNNKFIDPKHVDFSLLSLINDINNLNIYLQMDFSRTRILYTMWESTRINDLMIEILNKYKHICVPNRYNKDNFINQGLTTRIDVVPLFCDTEFYVYKEHEYRNKFVFGISNEDPRKNLSKVIKCFLKAFKGYNDVELQIKTNSAVEKHFDNKLKYIIQKLPKENLRDWYYGLDVYLSGATCEGWGMMQQESMCCGRPLIYTNYGGLSEFVNSNNGFEVGYDEVYSNIFWGDFAGRWSEFKEEEFIETMYYCYKNRDVVKEKGKISAMDASKFNKDIFIKNLINILNIYV